MSSAYIPENFFTRLSAKDLFGDNLPFEVDLGCGDGTFFYKMAEHYPDRHFLAIERLLGRVRRVCGKCDRANLTNTKVMRIESSYAVEWLLPLGSVSRLHLLCPDPWPKAKHHKNRLIQMDFLDSLHKVLAENGEFLFKTDHEEYFEWVIDHISRHPGFKRLTWEEKDFFYPKTDFQVLWESQGLKLQQARFIKI